MGRGYIWRAERCKVRVAHVIGEEEEHVRPRCGMVDRQGHRSGRQPVAHHFKQSLAGAKLGVNDTVNDPRSARPSMDDKARRAAGVHVRAHAFVQPAMDTAGRGAGAGWRSVSEEVDGTAVTS